MIRKLALVSLAVLSFQAYSTAAVLLSWDFNGFDGDAYNFNGVPPTGETYPGAGTPGITGSLVTGGGINGVGVGNPSDAVAIEDTFSANNWFAADLAEAESNGTFFEFNFNASGFAALDSMLLYLNLFSADGPTLYSVHASLNGGASFSELDSGTLVAGPQMETVDLSFLPYSGNGSVIFRLYAYGAVDSTQVLGFQNGDGDAIVINGTVPEPSTYALVLGGLAALAFYSVRSRKSPYLKA